MGSESQLNKGTMGLLSELLAVIGISLVILCIFNGLTFLLEQRKQRSLYRHMTCLPTSLLLGGVLGHVEHFWRSRTHLRPTVFLANVSIGVSKVIQQFNEGLVYFRIGPVRHFVACFNAKTAEAILTDTKNIIKAEEYQFVAPWLGQGLLLGNGAHWKLHRKLLTPTFHFAILNKFIPVMNYQMRTFRDILESRMDSNGRSRIDDIRPLVTNCTLDIICQTAMGVEMNAQKAWNVWSESGNDEKQKTPESEYIEAVHLFLEGILNRFFKPWLYPEFVFKLFPEGRQRTKTINIMQNFTNNVIYKRKEEMKKKFNKSLTVEESIKKISEGSRMDFLDLMLVYHLKGDDEFDLVAIREEVDTFMFAGHDTTSTALQFALMLIGLYPEKQKMIHEELDTIFGNDTERDITADDTKQMPYLEMCIKETLRLYPPVPFLGRNITNDFQCEKYRVPAGTTFIIVTQAVNRDPEAYEKPEHFIPERFSPNLTTTRNQFAFIPFSAGPRNCIGQRFAMIEMKICLATLLRQYQIDSLTKQDTVLLDVAVVCKPLTPIHLQFTRREALVK